MSLLTKLRKPRLFGLAIFDLTSAIIGLVLVLLVARRYFFPDLRPMNFCIAGTMLTIPIGIVFHILFGVNTTLNYRLGLSHRP